MYSCRQCTGYDECRSFFGRRGGSKICKNFNLVKENDDLVKGTDDLVKDLVNDLVNEIRRQTIEELNKELTELIQGDEEFTDWQKGEILLCLECAIENMKEVRND